MAQTEKPKRARVSRKAPLVKREFKELKKVHQQYTDRQIDFIRRTLAPTLNADELRLFIYRAQKLGLNPLNGEISAHVRNGKHGRQLVIIIGKDGKARKAMQTGLVEWATVEAIYVKKTKYKIVTNREGDRDLEEEERLERVEPWEGGVLWGARASVKRRGIKKPFTVVIPLREYQRGELYGQLQSTMIKKTALSQAYTMAFPDLFAGVYVDEELPTIMNEPKAIEPLANGGQPASEAQLQTIKAMGGADLKPGQITKQKAAELIKELIGDKK